MRYPGRQLQSFLSSCFALGQLHPFFKTLSFVFCSYTDISSYSWQGSVWLYCSEISPLEYRHIGGAFTAFGEWLMTWLTVFVGPIGLANEGARFWAFLLSGNIVAIVFVYFLCPETGGKTLESIDYLFQKGLAVTKDIEDGAVSWEGDKGEKTTAVDEKERT